MPLSVSPFVLRAKQLELEAIRHLADRVELVDVIGQLIHALQRERGACSIFLASNGLQFAPQRDDAHAAVKPVEAALRKLFAGQLDPARGATARMLSLMAWVQLDLDALAKLRPQIDQCLTNAHDTVAAFSRVIAGMLELVFHMADAAVHPGISRQLVAFVHLVQGKETAGQERAVGGQLFASGACSEVQQQRVIHLIDAQERSLAVFEEFADAGLRTHWQNLQLTPNVAQLERMRRTLCAARPGTALDPSQSSRWFDITSERITQLWGLETTLVQVLRQYCADQLRSGEQDLQDAEGLIQRLRDNPPPHTHAVTEFFNLAGHPSSAPLLTEVALARSNESSSPAPSAAPAPGTRPAADAQSMSSMVELLQTQSQRLASMEVELEAAKRALNERKIIERAKGVLMSRMGLSEEAAFRALQKTAMDQNRRLLDVAEATLSLPDLAFARTGGSVPR
jgi:hypothetical protein